MPDLDFAFLADYAKVEPTGTLTAVSASWTHIEAMQLPAMHRMAIAGRIRARMDDPPIAVRVEIVGPDDAFRIAAGFSLTPRPDARPYGDGHIGHLFAVDTSIPLPTEGLYEVLILIDDEPARRLAFEVVRPQS